MRHGIRNVSLNNRLLFSVLIVLLITARDVIGVGIPDVTFTVITAVAFMVMGFEDATVFLFFLLPLCSAIGFAEIMLLYLLRGIYSRWFYFYRENLLLGIVFLCAIGFIHNLFTPEVDFSASIMNWGRLYIYLIILYVVFHSVQTEQLRCQILKAFVAGAVFIGAVFIAETIRIYGLSYLSVAMERLGRLERNGNSMMTTMNANDFALLMLSSFMISVTLFFRKKMTLLLSSTVIIASLSMGLLTQSRSFLIGIIAFIVLMVSFAPVTTISLSRKILFVGILIAAYMMISDFFASTINSLMLRFGDQDISNGRFTIWQGYIELMKMSIHRFLFGYGEIGRLYFSQKYFGSIKSPHNFILDIFTAWGAVGFIVYWGIIIRMVLVEKKAMRLRLVNVAPFMAFFVFLFSLQYVSYGYPILITLLLIFASTIGDYYDESCQ